MEDEQIIEAPAVETVEQSYNDEQGDFIDHQQDMQEDSQFGNYPAPSPRESIFSFFNRVLDLKDSSKVANLDKMELGRLDLSVRNSEHLAFLGTALHNKSYHDFFMKKAEITLATSMSKKGWLQELVVTQKKFTQRSVQPMSAQVKKGFLGFGGNKTEAPQSPQ